MSVDTGRYDPELQMFRDTPRELNLNRLRFLRWLAEHGRLEHEAAGESIGPAALEGLVDQLTAA
jgi:hypothetical protein